MKRSDLEKLTKAQLIDKFATPETYKFDVVFEYDPEDPENIWWCVGGGSDGTDSVKDTLTRLLPMAIKEELAWAIANVRETED